MLSKLRKPLFFCLFLLFVTPLSYGQEERILDFDVKVQVNIDRSISVRETITVFATGQQIKRGITRNFPASRNLNGLSIDMEYDIKRILKNGEPEPFFTKSTNQGFMVYIGQKEVFLPSAQYTYILEYNVPNQIGFFEGFDEIYWNAIGTDVVFPIEKASCQITLPADVSPIQEQGYTGRYGSDDKVEAIQTHDNVLNYVTNGGLNPREGFTIAVGFPKGVVDPPSFFARYGTIIVIALGLLFLFPYYIYTWFRYGQDPPTPPSYPHWESPNNLSPASVSYISKEGYKSKSLTATIISLAIKGYLRIGEEEQSGLFSNSKNYELIRLDGANELLEEEELQLLNALFSSKDRINIDGTYQREVAKAYAAHHASIKDQHQAFIKEGNNLSFITIPLLVSIGIGALAFFLVGTSPYAQGVNLTAIIIFGVISVIGLILYSYLIAQPTVEKLDLKSRINGFKMYLEMSEEDRMSLSNSPDPTPVHFEKILPYAFALGVEKIWSDKFEKVLEKAKYKPDWNDSHSSAFLYTGFGNNFSRNMVGSATKPSESSSSSGSGGGGFSGGGGGGGGVGGW